MDDPTLFPTESPPQPVCPTGPFAAVAIERSLDRVLDYAVPPGLATSLRVGQRVRVPLGRGNKPTSGYVVEIRDTTATAARIKPVLSIEDDRILLTPAIMELARWMSRYYCCALGTVLESVIPAAVKKKVGIEYVPVVRLAVAREKIQEVLSKTRAPRRSAILARLLLLGPDGSIELPRLAKESGATSPTIRKLAKIGLIAIRPQPRYSTMASSPASPEEPEPPLALNEDQQKAFDELRPRLAGGFSVNLIHGVTGSGKTELYLRCIREVIDRGRRAIVLVPEIALTPQTVRRFTARFPRVAVLHSGLAASARHRFWQQIAQGQADVVVGARSAVFAPQPDLGIIVVDEEHESSYKQDTAPRYHARDLAIKRGQIENIPVILGSATPSLEMWHKCQAARAVFPSPSETEGRGEGETPRSSIGQVARYRLLSLPRRVRGLQLPRVELVDMRREAIIHRPGIHLISKRLETLLRMTVQAGHQAILLLNRRGYSSFIFCPSCQHVMTCKYCDVTLTYHLAARAKPTDVPPTPGRHTGRLRCHYCLAENPLPDKCPDCGKKLTLFGLGTQRVEEELSRKFPDLKHARVDSDSMRGSRDYESVLGRFARGEIQVMLGTQMIAKGLDYPNVTLVGVISGDTALALPDFRAAERTFQLITQVAGRAGRGDAPGHVVLQTFQPDHKALRFALGQDFTGFADDELRCRRSAMLPPYTRMVRFVLREKDDEVHRERLRIAAEELKTVLAEIVGQTGAHLHFGPPRTLPNETQSSYEPSRRAHMCLDGPMPCAINKLRGYCRVQTMLFGSNPQAIQRVLQLARGYLARIPRIDIDVDPVALL